MSATAPCSCHQCLLKHLGAFESPATQATSSLSSGLLEHRTWDYPELQGHFKSLSSFWSKHFSTQNCSSLFEASLLEPFLGGLSSRACCWATGTACQIILLWIGTCFALKGKWCDLLRQKSCCAGASSWRQTQWGCRGYWVHWRASFVRCESFFASQTWDLFPASGSSC